MYRFPDGSSEVSRLVSRHRVGLLVGRSAGRRVYLFDVVMTFHSKCLLFSPLINLFDTGASNFLLTGRRAFRMWDNLVTAEHGPCVESPPEGLLSTEVPEPGPEIYVQFDTFIAPVRVGVNGRLVSALLFYR